MNKRLISTALLTAAALIGCTSTGTPAVGTSTGTNTAITTASDIGMTVFKSAIDTQCRTEIEKQNAWRVASVALTAAQQEATKTKVCGCVSEQAPQHVTIIELGNAAISPSYRTELVATVVAKSLQSCYTSIIK